MHKQRIGNWRCSVNYLCRTRSRTSHWRDDNDRLRTCTTMLGMPTQQHNLHNHNVQYTFSPSLLSLLQTPRSEEAPQQERNDTFKRLCHCFASPSLHAMSISRLSQCRVFDFRSGVRNFLPIKVWQHLMWLMRTGPPIKMSVVERCVWCYLDGYHSRTT